MSIFQVFYVSRANDGLDVFDVRNILTISQRKNQYHGLTGYLLYSGRHFAQVLEGDINNISDLIINIAADSRHADMRILVNHKILARQYTQWSMACLYNLEVDAKLEQLLQHLGQFPPSDELLNLIAGVPLQGFEIRG